MKDESGFSLIFRLGMIPMFLFSGAFFPISNLDPVMEWLARLTPLWHGRRPDPDARARHGRLVDWPLIHVVYLVRAGGRSATGSPIRQLTSRLVD